MINKAKQFSCAYQHLGFLFGKVPYFFFFYFFNLFLGAFMYFGYKFFVRSTYCRYLHPFCGLSFHCMVHRLLQARILECIAFSRGSSQPRDQTQVFCIAGRFFTSWATRESQKYWSGLPFPFPRDLPNPEIKPMSPAFAGGFFTTESPGKSFHYCNVIFGGTEMLH